MRMIRRRAFDGPRVPMRSTWKPSVRLQDYLLPVIEGGGERGDVATERILALLSRCSLAGLRLLARARRDRIIVMLSLRVRAWLKRIKASTMSCLAPAYGTRLAASRRRPKGKDNESAL